MFTYSKHIFLLVSLKQSMKHTAWASSCHHNLSTGKASASIFSQFLRHHLPKKALLSNQPATSQPNSQLDQSNNTEL